MSFFVDLVRQWPDELQRRKFEQDVGGERGKRTMMKESVNELFTVVPLCCRIAIQLYCVKSILS